MEYNGIITIKKAIVHILKAKEGYIRLSDYEIERDKRLDNLITKHINTSIKNDTRRFASFNKGSNLVKDSSSSIFSDGTKFIEESKKIAKELFRSMAGTNASAANFLVAEYEHGKNKGIALLKLDFIDNFYTEEVEVEGKVKIVVKVKDAGFYENQRLQKCAFIYDEVLTDENSYIVILDKQTRGDVSNYFGNIFLNSSLVNDDRVNTGNMIDETLKFINKEYEYSAKLQMEKTYSLTSYFNENTIFDIETMVNKVFAKEEIIEEFKEAFKSKVIDYSFNIDAKRVEQKFKKKHITTSNGIELRANASLFNSDEIDIGEEDEEGYVNILIKKVKIVENVYS